MTTIDDAGPCFFCAELPVPGEKGKLDEEETHHASVSRRIRVGDNVGLIDGRGVRASAVVESVSRRALAFTVREHERVPPPEPALIVASAVPKGERFRTLIDMLAQIGVAGIIPLVCERSTVKPRQSSLERWRRIAIEACKQSRNPHVPRIHEPSTVANSFAGLAAGDAVVFADIDGAGAVPSTGGRMIFYVGPEGGFTDNEKKQLVEHGGRPFGLGGNVLRVETAALAGVVLTRLGTRG